ncbi:hypothetical protein [Dactylosporangium sp. CA-139066]|uniref:hypothetical protein n=1 Tax=Dactylosporangium sp. CA-139066 TaxID=3239930 RepID=UPI003D8E595D
MGLGPGGRRPKILSLLDFLEQHFEDVEFDLRRYLGVNLVEEIGSESLTWRMLGSFIERLPLDSALALAQAKPEERQWDMRNHLLATIADRLAVSNWLAGNMLCAWSKEGSENPVPKPEPIPRPGVEAPKKQRGMKALVRAMGAPV